jgi:tetratricopeptide (TPR) repeat protein
MRENRHLGAANLPEPAPASIVSKSFNGLQLRTIAALSSHKAEMSVCVSQIVLDLTRFLSRMTMIDLCWGSTMSRAFALLVFSTGVVGLPATNAHAQASSRQLGPCVPIASVACQNAQWDLINTAFDQDELDKTKRLLIDFLKRPDLLRPNNEARRAQALQLLGAVALTLQDLEGSKEASLQALMIWKRRANAAETETRMITQLNLANALAASQGFGEAETLARQLLAELEPAQAETTLLRIASLELLSNVLAGRQAPIEELVRKRSEIVALIRTQNVHPDEAANQRLILARALGNLGDAQMVAEALEGSQASLSEAEGLMRALSLPDSDLELVLLRTRWLPLLIQREDRCEVETVATRILPYAEPLGQRVLSQVLIQQGENYRRFGSANRAMPLWSRATLLELAMACPANATSSADRKICFGSPVLIDHLRHVGMSLRYEGQGRPAAGYRSLVQAGDFLRDRTLSGFALNRDTAIAYATSRDIFRDQITTAWAVNDPAAVPAVAEIAWSCPLAR